jgi:hypothetical protein
VNPLDARVGISVSPPDERELEARGVTEDHVRHAFVEIARQILAAGGSLAYGGDLREHGYTRTLIALLRTYSRADRPPSERIRQYLARPVWDGMNREDAAEVAVFATPVRVQRAADHAPGSRAARASDFTAMRERMIAETDARIVLGGRLAGQQGRWPGLVEEAYLALRARQPLFVVGGLGGAAARVTDALRGEWPPELTTEFQVAHTEGYSELLEAKIGAPSDRLREAFRTAELRNGLDDAENALLFETSDLDLIVALILRGLSTWRAPDTGGSSAETNACR